MQHSSHSNLSQFLFIDVQPCCRPWFFLCRTWPRLVMWWLQWWRAWFPMFWPRNRTSRSRLSWSRVTPWSWTPRRCAMGKRRWPTRLRGTPVMWFSTARLRYRSFWLSRFWLVTSWSTTANMHHHYCCRCRQHHHHHHHHHCQHRHYHHHQRCSPRPASRLPRERGSLEASFCLSWSREPSASVKNQVPRLCLEVLASILLEAHTLYTFQGLLVHLANESLC